MDTNRILSIVALALSFIAVVCVVVVWFRYSKSNKGPQGPGGEAGNAGNAGANGANGATGANPLAGLITTTQGSKDVTFLGNVIINGTTGLTVSSGDLNITAGDLDVGGKTTISGDLMLKAGDLTVAGRTTSIGQLYVPGGILSGNDLTVSGTVNASKVYVTNSLTGSDLKQVTIVDGGINNTCKVDSAGTC
jgi:hypothetical protein